MRGLNLCLAALLPFILASCDETQKTSGQVEVVNIQSPGGLKATQNPGCITLEQTTTAMTPPDLLNGIEACHKQRKDQAAADLTLLMVSRLMFDKERMTDASAGAAVGAMKYEFAQRLGVQSAQRIDTMAFDKSAPNRAATCARLKATGVPQYYPRYMVQHGMGVILGSTSKETALKPDFNATRTWNEVTAKMVRCS